RVHEIARRLLARGARLAGSRGDAESLPSIHGARGRDRPPLPARARGGAAPASPSPRPRLARLGVGVPPDRPAPHRSRPPRRRSRRCLHGRRALPAWLRFLVPPAPATL